MKAWVERGSSFRKTLNYAFKEGKRPEIVGGNMTGKDAKSLASEFGVCLRIRPDTRNPVWHTSLSLPEGETLTSDQWFEISECFMEKMEFDPGSHMYVVVQHLDTDYLHAHIIASRIGLDGKLWHGQFDGRKAIQATQELEKEFNLTATPGLDSESGLRSITKNELEKYERLMKEGKTHEKALPVRMKLQAIIQGASLKEVGIFTFMDALSEQGVVAYPNVAPSTGRLNGFSFELDGLRFSGRKLGKDFVWTKLQEKVIYRQDTDAKELIKRSELIKIKI